MSTTTETTTETTTDGHDIIESLLPQFVGLHGFPGVGKDAVAEILADYGYTRIAFADRIREALYVINPVIVYDEYGYGLRVQDLVDNLGWDDAKRQYEEIRRMLQILGTEVGREMIGQNVWVDSVFKDLDDGKKYVFTDMRFENEHQAIDSRLGLLIKIDRPGFGAVNDHKSEKPLPDKWFDVRLVNDGTLEDLHTKVREILAFA